MKYWLRCLLFFMCICSILTKNSPAFHGDGDDLHHEGYFSTIIASTIDGKLRALDTLTGRVKWTMQDDPVLRSPTAVKQGFTYLPDPQDGSLYTLRDRSLKKLPFSIPQLVQISPSRGADGIFYAGSKKDVWMGIDPVTGAKVETLSSLSADRVCPATKQENAVFIGRTEYKISMFDETDRSKTWNATFNDYSAHLLPESRQYSMKHYASSSTGNILTVDQETGEILWEQDLGLPVVALYLLQNDGLHRLPFIVMGRETMENVLQSGYVMDQWPTVLGTNNNEKQSTLTNSFLPTLYVGESPFGLYAIAALVDQQTITYSPRRLGPPLLEGPAPIALSEEEREEYQPPKRPIVQNVPTITYKTMEGEYLVLGYHEKPPMHMGGIIPKRPFAPYGGPAQIGDGGKAEQKRIPAAKKTPDDVSFASTMVFLVETHPKALMASAATVIALIVTVVWMCGRQWGAASVMTAEARSAQTSRQSNNGIKTWTFTRAEEVPDGWMNVGKLQYNPAEVLGRGCEGTVVYRGKFDGREVAVKRVVSEFVRFVDREADLLRESDAHPNVIRYFCMEADSQFRYLALELCVGSLNDYVEQKTVRSKVQADHIDILRQATDGLTHLHNSKIVHRDMKPQNVLLTTSTHGNRVRAVISDFGLCKRVQPGRNSLSRGLASGLAGTEGWIAPEVLISERTSYPVDIFSLGCIFYYVLSSGVHPYGKPIHRQANIVNGSFSLAKLASYKDGLLAETLIKTMLETDPESRPTSTSVGNHPLFWTSEKKLAFLGDCSDRVEKEADTATVVQRLESDAKSVVGGGWREKICDPLKEDLRKFRTYKSFSVRDLLRAMRNKKHHYRELPEDVRKSLGHIPDEFLEYFTSRFPKLILHSYQAMEWCSSEPVFKGYYSNEVRAKIQPLLEEDEKTRAEDTEKMNSPKWERGQTKKTFKTPKK